MTNRSFHAPFSREESLFKYRDYATVSNLDTV